MSAERLGGEAAMTTPHAPEGRDVQRWQMWCEFSHAHRPQKHPDGAFVEYADHVMALHAAYDKGATAERARLAGMSSEEEWDAVRELMDAAHADTIANPDADMWSDRVVAAQRTLLARLAAAQAHGLRAYRVAKGEACGLDLAVRCYKCEREYAALAGPDAGKGVG